MKTKLRIVLVYLSVLILKSIHASPIESDQKVRPNNEKWLTRGKFSNDNNLWAKLSQVKSSKLPSSLHAFGNLVTDHSQTASSLSADGKIVKSLDPRVRAAINQLLAQLNNSNRQKSLDLSNSAARAMQSFYPKCDETSSASDANQLLAKQRTYIPLYYDLRASPIHKPGNVILKSNLRVYLKKDDQAGCECKSDSEENDQLSLSVYEVLSKLTFLPLKEVAQRQHINTIRFDRCCDQAITLDLTRLVKQWNFFPESNNGIVLEVTNHDGDKLIGSNYIQIMNCSDKSLPLPYMRMIYPDLPNDLLEQTIAHYPTLDVAFNRNDGPFTESRRKSTQQIEDDQSDKDANV